MKKTIICIFSIVLLFLSYAAFGEDTEDGSAVLLQENNDINLEEPILLEPEESNIFEKTLEEQKEEYSPYSKRALKAIIEKDYNLNSPYGMFKDQLTYKFKRGPIKENTLEIMTNYDFIQSIGKDSSTMNFKILPINIGMMGKFRSEKESYFVIMDATPGTHMNFMHRLILDAWVESSRVPHHVLKFGTFRPMIGYEGSRCSLLIPFISKSQIARNLSNARKTGISVKGSYKYLDYYLEGFSSDIQYTEFFPGVEGDIWLDFKPLANLDKEKFGELKLSTGYQAGVKNSKDYNVASAGVKYNYKKLTLTSEMAFSDGSNGTYGYNKNKQWGYNVMLSYMLTKKLELLLRYDDFDADRKLANTNNKEYSAGINYYLLGQTLRFILNYIYSTPDKAKDNHKIIVGIQVAL